jgi:Amt family ammonium transporter
MFGAFTPALAIGATAERGRILPATIFIFCWATIVYDPIARWAWNPKGWANKMGALDFAGGTPVHISSGCAALVYSWALGPRQKRNDPVPSQNFNDSFIQHNLTHVFLGTVLIWFGWFGFNGGSAKGANLRAVMACVSTNLAACVGGLTWLGFEYYLTKKWYITNWCAGALAGLVAITPAAGYVPPWSAVVFGVVAALGCRSSSRLTMAWLGVDDPLDIFAIHGVGGLIGTLLTYLRPDRHGKLMA